MATTTTLCNFLVEKKDLKQFSLYAKKLGVSRTFVLRSLIKDFNKNPKIIIGEPETIKMSSKHQKLADQIMDKFENV